MARNLVTGRGSYNAICDVCGLKYKASDLKKRWDGAMVCEWDWETRHPQEFIRVKPDSSALPWTRSENDGIDVGPAVSCNGFEEETISAQAANQLFLAQTDNAGANESYTVYKLKTYGGTVHIPDGLTVHVHCTLVIGD